MASVSGMRRLPKSGIRACRPGVQTARRGIGIGAECRRGIPGSAPARECRPGGWHPFRPQRYRRAVGPGRIEPQAVLPPIFLDAPELAEVPGAAGERIGVKNPSRAGLRGGGRRPNPDTIRTGSVTAPIPATDPFPALHSSLRVALPYPISTTYLGRVCSSGKRSASPPRARKTSDLPPGIGISIGHPY